MPADPATEALEAAGPVGSAVDVARRVPPETVGPGPAGDLRPELSLLARGSALALAGQVTNAVLGFALAILVSRLFGVVGSGMFFEAAAIFTIAATIGCLGADIGISRAIPIVLVEGRPAEIRRLLRAALWPPLIGSTLLGAVMFFGAPEITRLVVHGSRLDEAVTYVQILAPFVPLYTLTAILLQATRGFDRIFPLVAIQYVGVPAIRPLLLGIAFLAGFGSLAVAVAWAAPLALGLVASVLALLVVLRRVGVHPSSADDPPAARRPVAAEFWRFSASRGVAAACNVVVLWLDVVLIGALVSTREAGIYGVASRYLIICSFIMGAVGMAIGPQASRLHAARRMPDADRVFKTGTAWGMAVAWPLCFTMAVFAPALMRIFGPGFRPGATSLSILGVAMLFATATGPNSMVLVMTGYSSPALVIAAAAMAVNVGLNFALVPHIGIKGAAVAWAATILVGNGLTSWVLARRVGIHPMGWAFGRVALSSAVFFGVLGLCLRAVMGPSFPAAMATVIIGGCLHLLFLYRQRTGLDLHAFRS